MNKRYLIYCLAKLFSDRWYLAAVCNSEEEAIIRNNQIAKAHRDSYEERYASHVYMPDDESYAYQVRVL